MNVAHAQSNPSNKKIVKKSRIEVSNLEGNWLCEDGSEIEFFKENEYHLIILPKVHIGPYTFAIDSNNSVQEKGYAPNWPPYYCKIEFLGPDIIKILYWHLGFKGEAKRYQKIDKPKN